ncbi:superoxide dismutase family protein [Oxobacter pfennigii]|nr:superoxide dismutase family protein [Oxobacter pfennigii]
MEKTNIAKADIKGGPLAPDIRGVVYFLDAMDGTYVFAEVYGLPDYQPGSDSKLPIGPHGFHIHEKGSCEVGDPENPFQSAGSHWNPTNQPHGNHAGDFPVLFSNHGKAIMYFFTDKFTVSDVLGKAMIIHESPDDFKSQPAGNAGRRLACGVINNKQIGYL